jgi:hypothetical protein
MTVSGDAGWAALLEGFPWFAGEGRFPLPAYSEFMPPPRFGRSPYGADDARLFVEADPFGWNVSEWEEAVELRPGLEHIAQRVVAAVSRIGRGEPDPLIAGHLGRNLADNPYWPPELAALAGRLPSERHIVLAPLALSRTQDDKGRVRWTLFGSSEQGPERAFWLGFFTGPGREIPEREAAAFFSRLLSAAYGETDSGAAGLRERGFRILPSEPDPSFTHWTDGPLPSWADRYLIEEAGPFDDVKYLLTFRPFGRLPGAVRDMYAAGRLALIPFPGSLVFWGQPHYVKLREALPLAMQIPLLKMIPRREGPGGLRVPQTGWLHEPGRRGVKVEIHGSLLNNTYRRTSRFDGVARHDDDALREAPESRVARALFGTSSEDLGLYGKPMARNVQIWTTESRLVLDGPAATPAGIAEAAETIEDGGLFRYRFIYPAMRVGRHEIYWHRPLAAFLDPSGGGVTCVPESPRGVLTAYPAEAPDPAAPVLLWPRILQRAPYVAALSQFDPDRNHYAKRTVLNILALLDAHALSADGRALPRDFARGLIHIAETETLEEWLSRLPDRAADRAEGERIRDEIERRLEPGSRSVSVSSGERAGAPERGGNGPLTIPATMTRTFEEGWWDDIRELSDGPFVNKDNADLTADPPGWVRLGPLRRDLEALGDHLLDRHRRAIAEAGLAGRAIAGEMAFAWRTDIPFPLFGGWRDNQSGKARERNILVIIPGRNRREAVVLADHYDTAYMEDLFYPEMNGIGARVASPGADDNHSATATLLRAAPVYLRLAAEGRLERDIWLVHLTGEEFPADCLGARNFVRELVESRPRMRTGTGEGEEIDLSETRIRGVFIMDMVGHNRMEPRDVFQIAPGKGPSSLRLAELAQRACSLWNAEAASRNRGPERRGLGRGRRSPDGTTIPPVARYPLLRCEIRTEEDPRSSLFNTDGQIFSDAGIPVVLFMEDYDIDRTGYHDTRDTAANIDLDYGAALAAVAIETTAQAAAEVTDRSLGAARSRPKPPPG